jgi:hypothetical protein
VQGNATTRKTRGLTRSVIALMMPPFSRGVSAFEQKNNARAAVLDPVLQITELDLKLSQLLQIVLRLSTSGAGERLACSFHCAFSIRWFKPAPPMYGVRSSALHPSE